MWRSWALPWGLRENWPGSEMGSSHYTYCQRHRRVSMMSPYRNSSSSCLFLLCSSLLNVHPSTPPCRSSVTQDGFLRTRMGRWSFPLFQQIRLCPAFLEPKCLILSWLVVPDEKGVAFHCSIQKESLLLGSVMKMVQMGCSDTSRPVTQCMLRLFPNEDQGLETEISG